MLNIEKIKARIEIGHETDGHVYKDIPALLEQHKQDQQQITILKKALDLMSRTACDESKKPMSDWDMVGCPPHVGPDACNGGNNGMCHECWMKYFMAQAQQTHATQEAEK